MYLVVNSSITMSKGKTCSQVGHSVAGLTRHLEHNPTMEYINWKNSGEPMIVVKAKQETLEFFVRTYSNKKKKGWCEPIYDAGHTQVEHGQLTVVGFSPSVEAPNTLRDLQLL